MRAKRYTKIDDLQKDLDQLLKDADKDKKKFKDKERTLGRKAEVLESEIKRLQSQNRDDHEFFRMETLRKDQAIENM